MRFSYMFGMGTIMYWNVGLDHGSIQCSTPPFSPAELYHLSTILPKKRTKERKIQTDELKLSLQHLELFTWFSLPMFLLIVLCKTLHLCDVNRIPNCFYGTW